MNRARRVYTERRCLPCSVFHLCCIKKKKKTLTDSCFSFFFLLIKCISIKWSVALVTRLKLLCNLSLLSIPSSAKCVSALSYTRFVCSRIVSEKCISETEIFPPTDFVSAKQSAIVVLWQPQQRTCVFFTLQSPPRQPVILQSLQSRALGLISCTAKS